MLLSVDQWRDDRGITIEEDWNDVTEVPQDFEDAFIMRIFKTKGVMHDERSP